MDTWVIVVIVVVAVVLVALIAWMLWRRRQRDDLPARFGPEYDRTVERTGDEGAAREDLQQRLERRDRFDIRSLDEQECDRYFARWAEIQHDFVDAPERAVEDADRLIQDVMRARGYPVEDFEQRARDLSVDYPHVVEEYRAARTVLDHRGRISTEKHREAMVHLRNLFEQLVGSPARQDRTE